MKKKIKGARKKPDKGSESGTFFNIGATIKDLQEKKILKFVGLYLFYIGFLTLLYITFKEDLSFIKNTTASVFSYILVLLGVDNTINGTVIYLDTISLMVIDECTGMYELLVY